MYIPAHPLKKYAASFPKSQKMCYTISIIMKSSCRGEVSYTFSLRAAAAAERITYGSII